MEKEIVYKVPGGKLLKIFLNYDLKTNEIENIVITGDFFAYPEESIEDLEKVLTRKILDRNILIQSIESFVIENKVEFIGLDATSLTNAILEGIL